MNVFGAGAGAGVVEDGPSFVFGSAAAALLVAPAANNDFVTGTSMDAVPAVEPFPSCRGKGRKYKRKVSAGKLPKEAADPYQFSSCRTRFCGREHGTLSRWSTNAANLPFFFLFQRIPRAFCFHK